MADVGSCATTSTAWSRAEWIEATSDTWQTLVEPIAAHVVKAMAEAFRSGGLRIMDYYKLRNVQADTDMRRSIATTGAK